MVEEDDIEDVVMGYCKEIFTSLNLSNMDQVLDLVDPCITSNIIAVLLEAFTVEEVIKSLHQIHLTKAPNLDGIPTLFFKNNMDPSFINGAYITLILKTHNPSALKIIDPLAYAMWFSNL